MTSPKLLLPVRVPELGPALGKLLTGTGRQAGAPTFDRFRLQLVGRLFEAAGEARRLAAAGERHAAIAAVDARVWLDAWEETASGIGAELVARANERLSAEAAAVRMPGRMRRRVILDPAEVRGVAGRLGASGGGLVAALDELHARGERLRGATAAERDALNQWQDALVTSAGRTEGAWLLLEEAVDAELTRWESVAATVARWRRPRWPIIAVGVPLLAGATWLGLVLGGYVNAPGWLQSVWGWL
jgi:hypothetical protein